MNPIALIRLQAELEYGVSIRGDTIPITPSNTRDVPDVTVARHAHGHVVLFRADLAPSDRTWYQNLGAARLFSLPEDDDEMLLIAPGVRTNDCCWYCINRIPDLAEFPDVVCKNDRFVVERNGQIAAAAWSAQNDNRAAEVEVETQPAYRRRGFGRQVVAAWAHHVRRDGKIALYSHLTSNQASQALATAVGAWKYAETREFI